MTDSGDSSLNISLLMHQYAWDVKGLDPIGASDIIRDLQVFTNYVIAKGEFESVEKTWDLFCDEVIVPVYGLEKF